MRNKMKLLICMVCVLAIATGCGNARDEKEASIEELNGIIEEKDNTISELENRIAALEDQLETMESVSTLSEEETEEDILNEENNGASDIGMASITTGETVQTGGG